MRRRFEIVTGGVTGVLAAFVIIGCAGTAFAAATGKKPASPKATERSDSPAASARPNFTGTWKLSMTRSSFGKIPGGQPKARTDVIDQRDSSLVQTLYLDLPSGKDTTHYRYLSDSSECLNRVDRRDIRTRVWWEGSLLRLESHTTLFTFDMSLKERWLLSDDGKTFTMQRHAKWPMGEGVQTLLFEKQ